jgi:hypothetical protein
VDPGVNVFDYAPGIEVEGVVDIGGAFAAESADLAAVPEQQYPGTLWPMDGNELGSLIADVFSVGPFHLTNITWSGGGTPQDLQVLLGNILEIAAPVDLAGKYEIIAIDLTGTDIKRLGLKPAPPTGGTVNITLARITAAASKSIRQLITANTEPDGNRHGNAIHPIEVEVDFVELSTTQSHVPEAFFEIPFPVDAPPSKVSVSVRTFTPPPEEPPAVVDNYFQIALSQNGYGGTFSADKSASVLPAVSYVAPDFGVQSFSDGTWGTGVPAGTEIGDHLVIAGGPNQGIYVITEILNDAIGHRVYTDKPFPAPGNNAGGFTGASIQSAKAVLLDDGEIVYSFFFDLSSLPAPVSPLIARIKFNRIIEINSVTVQWT